MDKKALKEEKKKLKLEKFLNKKLNSTVISKSTKSAKKPSTGGYDPLPVEQKWNEYWLKEDLFKPVPMDKVFTIPMPPPNVTGSLHIGHAMMVAIQDSLCRYKRMTGHEVLYLPGTDHAGIATQTVVMKQLEKEKKKCDRESFLEATWEWKEKYGSRILEQFKRLGSSADISRQRFTMDSSMNKAVTEAFCILHEKGLIYRENKIISWCAKLQTTLSDIEIDHKSVEPNTILKVDGRDYEFGVIYVFKYPILNSPEYIEVGTTRPETILGDVALCANPKDTRYSKDIIPINPLTNKELKFVFDDLADMDLESGVLKVTPAHDPVDFEIGKKHSLEQIKIFDSDNRIIIEGEYKGLKRLEARDLVLKKLKEKGLFIATKPKEQILPICSRSGDLIEPIIKEQWWCECTGMAKKALDVVKSNEIEIIPSESKEDWYRWFESPRDWCLSRQLWWGHRIPAYYCDGKWTIGRSKEEAVASYNKKYNTDLPSSSFTQDEDVLDTWFSSGLWPFATLGWPEETPDFKKYFPSSLLETGKDILFFWVGRMVMMSLELTGKIPFSQVLLHGIVRDANGRKMSKSLGNVIDPLHVIDGTSLSHLLEVMKLGNLSKENQKNAEMVIRKDFPNGIEACGADALRFTLLSYMNGINDIKLDIERVKGNRKFCNKIWNAFLFVKRECIDNNNNSTSDNNNSTSDININDDFLIWIIQKRNKVISTTHSSLKNYNFMSACQSIHQFFLYDFCDIFIEVVKKIKKESYITVLHSLLLDSIKIFSPYMPFITEEIYSHFSKESLINTPYPEIIPVPTTNTNFENVLKRVKGLRADLEKYGKSKVDVTLEGVKEEDLEYIKALVGNIRNISVGESDIINLL